MTLHVSLYETIERALEVYKSKLEEICKGDELLIKNKVTLADLLKEKENCEGIFEDFKIPINFNEYGKELLGRFQHVVSKQWFSVSDEKHKELVSQMRTATYKENGNLDKSETGNITYDVFDSTRLCLKMFEMSDKR